MRLEGTIRLVDHDGRVLAQAEAVPALLHLPGSPLHGSFRYLTGKRVSECLTGPVVRDAELDSALPLQASGRFAVGQVLIVNVPGSPLHGIRLRNRGLLDIGWRALPGVYSCDILDGPGKGGTTSVYEDQCIAE